MNQAEWTRRAFLGAAGAGLALGAVAERAAARRQGPPAPAQGGGMRPVSIASGNGLRATSITRDMLKMGSDPLDAIVEGVKIIEDDPADNSVGYGGLPNEEGIVELDASVMHGPMHRAAAVASLRNIKNPAAVAREVARRTDHVLVVGEGALKFALRMGFKEENLLTEESRNAWLKWRASLSKEDKWLDEEEWDLPGGKSMSRPRGRAEPDEAPHGVLAWEQDPSVPMTSGTVHVSAVTAGGDLAGCTSTSGLAWKLPGRVGDSPIIGAGLYTDNEVGSAGGTGRGEAMMQSVGAFAIVSRMGAGDSPTEACLNLLKSVVAHTKQKRLLDDQGRPRYDLTVYALRKDGAYGSASIWEGRKFAVSDGAGDRLEDCAFLYERPARRQ